MLRLALLWRGVLNYILRWSKFWFFFCWFIALIAKKYFFKTSDSVEASAINFSSSLIFLSVKIFISAWFILLAFCSMLACNNLTLPIKVSIYYVISSFPLFFSVIICYLFVIFLIFFRISSSASASIWLSFEINYANASSWCCSGCNDSNLFAAFLFIEELYCFN